MKIPIIFGMSLSQGGSYKYTFDTKGTFNYICGLHPSMKGKIEVN